MENTSKNTSKKTSKKTGAKSIKSNAKQKDFCSKHAEALEAEVSYRFGEI